MVSLHTIVVYACFFAVVIPGSRLLVELGSGEPAPPLRMLRRFWRRPVPWVAAALVAVQVVTGILQLVDPAIIGDLERVPGGGWWRCLTALWVQSDGGLQLVFNLAAMIVIAPVAERVLGAWRTVAIFLISGVAAQAVSLWSWSPHGGGDSVAMCGLLAALAVGYALRTQRWVLWLIPLAGVVLCIVTNNHGMGLVVGALLGAISYALGRRPVEARQS